MYSFKGWQNNKTHVFPSKRCTSNEKTCYCYTFYNKKTYVCTCTQSVIRNFYLLKSILAYCGYSPNFSILLYAFCRNINTAIMRQLIRTVRTLEAEWWQVCGEVWVQGQRKMSQVLGAFGLLDFTMLRPILAWRVFLNLWTIYFFNFPNFFPGRGQPQILNPRIRQSTCIIHFYGCFLYVQLAM